MQKGHITIVLLVIAVLLVSGCTISSETAGNETTKEKAVAEPPKDLCKVKAPDSLLADNKVPFVLTQKDVSGNWTVFEPTILPSDEVEKLGAEFASMQATSGDGKSVAIKIRFYEDVEFGPYSRDSEKVVDNETAGFENSFVGYNPTARTSNSAYLIGKSRYVALELKNDEYPGTPELRQADRELLKELGKKLLC